MRVLVTGGAGFIGSHVVRQLLARGADVRVFHLPGDNLLNLEGLDVELLAGDVRDAAAVTRAVHRCDQVYHLAALYALWLPRMQTMIDVNVGGTRNVLEACLAAGVERVVYTSSIAVFGGQGLHTDATEDSPFALGVTGDVYSRSKYESHRVAEQFAARGLPVVIVAPCGPIGPGDIGPTPTGRLLLAAASMPVALAPNTVTNLIDVRDCAAGHLLAAERGRIGESYLLGAHNVDTATMIREARRIATGRAGWFAPAPYAAARMAAYAAVPIARAANAAPLITPAAVSISQLGLRASCSKAVRELGLPQRPLEESVRDALVWFAEHGYIRSKTVRQRLARTTRNGRPPAQPQPPTRTTMTTQTAPSEPRSAATALTLDDLAAMTAAELEDLYRQGTMPDSMHALDGTPRGRMLALAGPAGRGLALSLTSRLAAASWFPWRGKSFQASADQLGGGINRVALLGEKYAFDTIIEASAIDGQPCIFLDYDKPSNPFFIRAVRDELRQVAPGLFLGPAMIKRRSGPVLALWFAVAQG